MEKDTPKTWEELQRMDEDSNFFLRIDDNLFLPEEIKLKCIAAFKIAKLIEVGYGGMVNIKNDKDIEYCYSILPHKILGEETLRIGLTTNLDKRYISFHTSEQANEFLMYKSNRQLAKDYYMM